ncbi:TetR/AcrR family transcriptional regulator [Pontibacter sp. MBLB2868]|uniref:TetR/AcrR family transcriptional regulator n=1 Tax=Pontibacter sp. MBLB2868 TaxID=3451555 RepID=UPI003F7508BD
MTFLETILEETLQIFKKEGIEANSEEQLIRKLDIRESSYNEMFKSKTELVRETVLFDIDTQEKGKERILALAQNPVEEIMLLLQDGLDNLQSMNPLYFVDLQQSYPEIWKLCLDHLNSHSYHQISDIINRGIIESLFRKDVNLQLVTKIILEQITMILNPVVFPPERYNIREVFRSVYLYYLRGICTEHGGKMAEEFFSKINNK